MEIELRVTTREPEQKSLPSLKLTTKAPENRPFDPIGKDRIPTIHFLELC